MNEELMKKCRLTPPEICKELGGEVRSYPDMGWKHLNKVAKAQLAKAIPLISAQYEADAKQLIEGFSLVQLIAVREARKQERELLLKAVELIKEWHNGEAVMKLGQEQADNMWNIYYNNAPEMKEIRVALKEGGKEAE